MLTTDPSGPRLIVALDYATSVQALAFADRLDPSLCRIKVGFELYVAAGPAIVEALNRRGFEVFLDLKFHDIPNTVAAVCRAAARLGVWMINLHASGGRPMMAAARQAAGVFERPPRLIGVTVLTSLGNEDLNETGVAGTIEQQVLKLGRLVSDSGLEGVVCSAREAPRLRQALGDGFTLVCPGIRPAREANDDQARTMTAHDAAAAGADYLVVGRPVTTAAEPAAVLASLDRDFHNGRRLSRSGDDN